MITKSLRPLPLQFLPAGKNIKIFLQGEK